MLLFCPKESSDNENRCALTPDTAKKFTSLGCSVVTEAGLGETSGYLDTEYTAAGAKLTSNPTETLGKADIVLRVQRPDAIEIPLHKKNALLINFLDPFNETELLDEFAKAQLSAISLQMLPRTTLAQKMDALSSQANLAGYVAVILGATRLNKILPMLMTPAGTISPARVFIVGVGVSGLQAIATAKRMGARVDAFDTRPVVEEQVKSLGGKFVKIDLGKMEQTAQGYAKELTPEQIEKQRAGMEKICAQSDIVITTAKLFGRPAPKIITAKMVAAMQNGSVIVDLAAEGGGNVEGTVLNEEIMTDNGVRIIGYATPEGFASKNASQVFASNLYNMIEHFWNKEEKTFTYNLEDEILQGSLLTHQGKIIHERFQK